MCDGLLLAYPVLDMKMKYSPSHQKGLTDYMLSHTVMDICINAYTKHKDSDPINDCIMSPAFLSQEVNNFNCNIVDSSTISSSQDVRRGK